MGLWSLCKADLFVDLEGVVGQGPRECLRLVPGRAHSDSRSLSMAGIQAGTAVSVRDTGTECSAALCLGRRCRMSKETPKDDPRQQTDEGSLSQTDKPWKGNPEKEQRNDDTKIDLEKWQRTSTH